MTAQSSTSSRSIECHGHNGASGPQHVAVAYAAVSGRSVVPLIARPRDKQTLLPRPLHIWTWILNYCAEDHPAPEECD